MTTLRVLTVDDAGAVLALRVANREHFRRSEPLREPSWFTPEAQRAWLSEGGAIIGAFVGDDWLAGFARLSQISGGGFRNAYLGYAVGEEHCNKGIGSALVRAAVDHAFDELGLHRVQANVRPDNEASKRILEKAGFRREGLALRYLQLDGRWVDHELYALTAEERPAETARPYPRDRF